MGFKSIVASVLLTVFAFGGASATTYYISQNGSGGDGRSWATAWTTIDDVNTGVSSGDTVFFGTGTWIGTQLRCVAGSYSDRTVYACSSFADTNYEGEYHFAKIWGASSLANANQNVIQCHYDNNSRLSYVTLYGLELAYGRPRVISIYGVSVDSFFVEHCKLYGCNSSEYNNPSLWHSGTMVGNEGSFNRLVACSLSMAYGPGGGHGCGIDMYSQNYMTVDSCVFHGHFDGACLWWKNDNDGLNYGNVVKNSIFTPTSADYGGGVWLYRNQNDDSVYNNIFAGGLTRGVRIGNHTSRPNYRTVILNNTFINVAGLGGDRNCIDGYNTSGTVFKYNVEVRTSTPFHVVGECLDAADLDVDSNIYVIGSAQAEYGYANYVSQSYWINTLGQDGHSARWSNVSNIGFADYGNGDYTRSPDSIEMDVYFDNRVWNYYGANLQPAEYCPRPLPPSLAGPANGSSGLSQPISLVWNSSSGADEYQVQVDNNVSFSSPEFTDQLTGLTTSVSGLAEGTTYYWRVRAGDTCGFGGWSQLWSFSTSGDAGGTDTVSPAAIDDLGAVPGEQPGEIQLTWTATGDDSRTGTLARYEIMWSLEEITGNYWSPQVIMHSPSPPGYQETVAITELREGYTYYLVVQAFDEAGNASGLSNVAESFAAGIRPPPWLFTRVDEFGLSAELTCSTVVSYMNVDTYRFALVDSASGDSSFLSTSDVTNSTVSVTFSGLDESALYYWVSQAISSGQDTSLWSQTKKFHLSNVCPDPPTASFPADNDTVAASAESFTLTVLNGTDDDSSGALTYDFELYGENTSATLASVAEVAEGLATTSWTLPITLEKNKTYTWRARTHDGEDYSFWMEWSHFLLVGATASLSDEAAIIAFPNPVHFGQGEHVTFRLGEEPVDLLIQTVSGETVLLKTGISGDWRWSGENESGNRVAVGVYSWFVRGTNQNGKIVVKP